MKVKEVSSNCDEARRYGACALIIGVSINNSYFNEKNLERLLVWASRFGIRPKVFIPDGPMIDTFIALGYSEKVAAQKARIKANALENKCHMIMGRHDLDNIRVVRWSELAANKVYLEGLKKMENLYAHNEVFKKDVHEATEKVLKSNGVIHPEQEKIEIGTGFLIKELAFMIHACFIFHEEKYCSVYHRKTQILFDLIEGNYGIDVSDDIGAMVVE
jgi:tRNA-dependent cyclodipeptide synthase